MSVITGTGADEVLNGTSAADTIDGGGGNDTLTGGLGADTFVVGTNEGAVTITDFSPTQGDIIDLSGFTGLNYAGLLADAAQPASDTIITIGSTSITLQNVALGSLTAADFLLSGAYSQIAISSSMTIDAGQAVAFSGSNTGHGAYGVSGSGSLKVYGSLLVQGGLASDSLVGVETTGSTGAPVFWIEPGASVTVRAEGSGSSAYGFYAGNAAPSVENDGTLSVSSTGSASGVFLKAGGTFSNTGTITVTSSGGTAYGVLGGDNIGGVTTIVNSGVINAQYAINSIVGSGHLVVHNSGTLNGSVVLGTGAGNELHNTGSITGNVGFDGTSGVQLYDGRGGSVVGRITFTSSTGVTGTDAAHLGNDGETVQGGTADLFVYGGTGADHVTGGAGNNVIDGGGGNDTLDGGGGMYNTVVYELASSAVTVSLALQGQAQNTGVGTDVLTHFQNLVGSKFDDHLTGDVHDNIIEGYGGNDTLDGGGGLNTVAFAAATTGVTVSLGLQGQAQNTGIGTDVLTNFRAIIGSPYNDTLEGGGGDVLPTFLTGGAGADTFVYKSGDGPVTILDFSPAQGDKISIEGLGSVHTLEDVLRYATQDGSDAVLSALGDGSLRLVGVSLASLTAADFGMTGATGPTPFTPAIVGPASGGPINGTSGSDWLDGGPGPDVLHGGAGSDTLEGGGGLNTALYDGAYRQYSISLDYSTVTGGPEGGTDVLIEIQRIQFADGYLAISPTDTAGQVYRVYEATLGRAPDQEGLTNWVHALNGGASLQSVVDGFVGSQEFQADYGNVDNAGFVTLLYHNVLHRDPDAGGLSSWVGLLDSGQDTRAQVVTGFSESQEDITDLSAPVQQGLWIGDAAAGEVARLYDTMFSRLPDGSGLANWTHALEGGTSLQSVADGFVGSAEFQATYGALDNAGFVTLLYHNVLHRDPDSDGLGHWVDALNSGQDTRAQVVVGFSESPEHVGALAPQIDSGVWLAG